MAKAPIDIKSLARLHTQNALNVLGGIASNGTSEGARVAACVALLDRGWGKAAQAHTGADGEGDITITIRNIIEEKKQTK